MPGDFMSTSTKEIPFCGLPVLSVRTRQKIQSANCPSVFHTLLPLRMYSSPSRSAFIFSDARSEPEPFSE